MFVPRSGSHFTRLASCDVNVNVKLGKFYLPYRSSAVHVKNTDSEDISKKLSSSYKPLFKSDEDSSEEIGNIEKQFCDQKHRLSQFDDDLFMLVELTELDKLVLDNLISKCIFMIEDREEIIKPTTQSERNMVFLDILTERPYATFRLFKDVLKESDPCNDDVQELLNKIHWPENSDENFSCHDIIMFDHIVKLQKNYMMFVRDADCKTDIADHLYEADILNTKERKEICNPSFSRHESNRTLFKILLRKGGNAYKLLFEALRDEKWYDLATKMETTRISQQEIQLCQIGKTKFRERQKKKEVTNTINSVAKLFGSSKSDDVVCLISIMIHIGLLLKFLIKVPKPPQLPFYT
ncbi:unnamed protein product [Mytilus coruscus]|uniref:CARD domain-containing protein n=1 Tax=Mytilus coruscus TaxID=42192 RepID=A0A6J8EBG3_MYTCO|nr:unnamed protein product [Mytilus coruscus]